MSNSRNLLAVAVASLALLLTPAIAWSQQPDLQEKVAALKQAMADDQKNLRQYEWIETTVVSLKGEEKSRQEKQCYYGADGVLQKVTMSSTPPGAKKRGLRGKVIENKKEEMTDYMKAAVALVKTYIPPDPAKIQALKEAGKISIVPPGGGRGARLDLHDYAKPGDLLSVQLGPENHKVAGISVATYLDDVKDAVTMDASFSSLEDGTGYPASEVLVAKAKNLSVNITNSGYRKSAH